MPIVNVKSGSQAVYFDPASPSVAAVLASTIGVNVDSIRETIGVRVGQVDGSVAVYFSPSNPAVAATFAGSIATYFDPAEPTIKGITNTIRVGDIPGSVAVYFSPSNPTVSATFSAASLEVIPSTGSRIMYDQSHQAERVLIVGSQAAASIQVTGVTNTVRVGDIPGTVAVYFSPANPSVSATFSAASLEVIPTTGSRILYDQAHQAQRVIIAGTEASSSLQVRGITNSIDVYVGATAGTMGVRVGQVDGSVAVYFSPANPAVAATFSGTMASVPTSGSGSTLYDETADAMRVLISGSHAAASLQIIGITNTVNVDVGRVADTVSVMFSPSHPTVKVTGSIATNPFTPAGSTMSDEGYDAQRVLIAGSHAAASLVVSGQQAAGTNRPFIVNTDGAVKVYDIADGSIKISGYTSSLGVYVDTIRQTIGVRVGQVDGTVAVYFSPSEPTIKGITNTIQARIDPGYNVVNNSSTIVLPRVAVGSYSGVSDLGITLASPAANSNIKVCGYSILTTALTSTLVKFTNGAGAATDLWRPLATPAATASELRGANLAVSPPAYLFSTGANVTLALHTGNAALIHYSVSYFRESA